MFSNTASEVAKDSSDNWKRRVNGVYRTITVLIYPNNTIYGFN